MQTFIVLTKSESGDTYTYHVQAARTPTHDEVARWLAAGNANDIEDGVCYEYVEDIVPTHGRRLPVIET